MGIDLVVIVENSKGISFQAFRTGILQSPVLGPLVWNLHRGYKGDEIAPWEAFVWEDKTYFTWLFSCVYPFGCVFSASEGRGKRGKG